MKHDISIGNYRYWKHEDVLFNMRFWNKIPIEMKSTLKVHNPRVIICISDVQCVIYECHR